jgi:type II secretory pathway component PulJ
MEILLALLVALGLGALISGAAMMTLLGFKHQVQRLI